MSGISVFKLLKAFTRGIVLDVCAYYPELAYEQFWLLTKTVCHRECSQTAHCSCCLIIVETSCSIMQNLTRTDIFYFFVFYFH